MGRGASQEEGKAVSIWRGIMSQRDWERRKEGQVVGNAVAAACSGACRMAAGRSRSCRVPLRRFVPGDGSDWWSGVQAGGRQPTGQGR